MDGNTEWASVVATIFIIKKMNRNRPDCLTMWNLVIVQKCSVEGSWQTRVCRKKKKKLIQRRLFLVRIESLLLQHLLCCCIHISHSKKKKKQTTDSILHLVDLDIVLLEGRMNICACFQSATQLCILSQVFRVQSTAHGHHSSSC